MNNIIFQLKEVQKTFKQGSSEVEVFSKLNLQIESNKSMAILGASGSGKSSLLHLLAGLDKPTSGSITYQGINLEKLNLNEKSVLRNNELGFVYQFHHLLPEFTALENVAMPLFLSKNYEKDHALNKANELLQKVGLESRMYHLPGELSGGERQRVAIARSLSNDPICLIMDEPTGDLDRKNSLKMFDLIIELSELSPISLIIATHDMDLASKLDISFSLDK